MEWQQSWDYYDGKNMNDDGLIFGIFNFFLNTGTSLVALIANLDTGVSGLLHSKRIYGYMITDLSF